MIDKLLKSWKVIGVIVGIITLTVAFNATYAKNGRVDLIAMRLDLKIKQDKANAIQERIWNLESYHGCYSIKECSVVMTKDLFDQYRRLKKELKDMEDG